MKRFFDFIVALIALIILTPLFFIIVVIIKTKLGSPIFFKQTRPGVDGRIFRMVKFRTMTDERDCSGKLLCNEERTPPFGKFLRNSSLDELPELWNVLKGSMSLVGPRPLKIEYLELYDEHQRRRHDIRPGITGWAQINGRNTASWEDRFDMDVWYVENQTLWLDIKILFLTVYKVIRKEDVDHLVDEVAGRFTGTKDNE